MLSSGPRDGIMQVQNARWIINRARPRFAVIKARWMPHAKLHIKLKYHLYCAIDFPAETADRVNGSKPQRSKWRDQSICFIPAGWDIRSSISQERQLVLMIASDEIFKKAATKGIEYLPENFHYVSSIPAPAAATLMSAFGSIRPGKNGDNLSSIYEMMAVAIAARVMKFFNDLASAAKEAQPDRVTHNRIQRVIDFVDTNIGRKMQLPELADVAALSPYHFSRAFKRATGTSPLRYVWRRRVDRAKALLRNRDLSLTIIAIECGFSSQSHFTTTFKRSTGVTPAQYRVRL